MKTSSGKTAIPLLLIEASGKRLPLLARLCWFAMGCLLLAAIGNAAAGAVRAPFALGCGAIMAGVALMAERRGHVEMSARWLVLSSWVTLTWLTWLSDGTHDSAVMAYPVVLIFAGLMLSRRTHVALLVATVAWLLLIGHGEIYGWYEHSLSHLTNWSWLFNIIIALAASSIAASMLIERLVATAISLQAAQSRHLSLIEKNPAAVIEWDMGFQVREWSASAQRIFGHTREQALGQHARFITPPERWEVLDRILLSLSRGEKSSVDGIGPSLCADGRTVLCRWSFQPIVDHEGRAVGLASFAEDITEQRATEEALRQLEQRRAEFLQRQFEVAGAFMRGDALRSGDGTAALHAITEGAHRVLAVARASIWMHDEERQQLHCADLYLRDAGHSSGTVLMESDYPSYFQALQQQRVIAANDAAADPRTCEFRHGYLDVHGIGAMLDVPVLQQGRLRAVLCLEHVGGIHEWTAEEQGFAATLGDHLLIVLETLDRQRARAEAQQAIEQSDAVFSSIFEESPLPMAVASVEGQAGLIEVNQAFEAISGHRREFLIGKVGSDIGLWSDEDAKEVLRQLQREGQVSGREMTLVSASGEAHQVLISARIRQIGAQRRVFWYGMDVTDIRRAQREISQLNASLEAKVEQRTQQLNQTLDLLRQAQQSAMDNLSLLRTVADNIPSLIAYYDKHLICRFVNRSVEHFSAKKPEDVLNQHIHVRIPYDAREMARPHLEAVLRGERRQYESRHVWPDGRVQHCEVLYIPDWVGDHVDGFFVRIDDITDRKRSEDEILALNRSLEQRLEQLGQAMETLQNAQADLVRAEKLSALGALVAGVAHELNTPIGNALTVASTMDDKTREFCRELDAGNLRKSALTSFTDVTREANQLIMRNLMTAGELVRSFKQVAVDQTSAHRRDFDLRETIEEVLTTLRHQLKAGQVRLQTDLVESVRLDSYPGPLGQVITNLFNNALLHAFEGGISGVIHISSRRLDAEQVEVRFEDDGSGVSEEHLPKLFNPFFTTKMGRGGSGLGLNIVHNIVTGLLGGRISVNSSRGQGTCFVITLPLTAPASASVD